MERWNNFQIVDCVQIKTNFKLSDVMQCTDKWSEESNTQDTELDKCQNVSVVKNIRWKNMERWNKFQIVDCVQIQTNFKLSDMTQCADKQSEEPNT